MVVAVESYDTLAAASQTMPISTLNTVFLFLFRLESNVNNYSNYATSSLLHVMDPEYPSSINRVGYFKFQIITPVLTTIRECTLNIYSGHDSQ